MSDPSVYIFDSFALLAYLGGETGADKVKELLVLARKGRARLLMSVVNLGEVLYIVEREAGLPAAQLILARMEELPIEVLDANRRMALDAAHIKANNPIAYDDCFAAALARQAGATLVTGDPELMRVEDGGICQILWLE